jgi:hypothetical protein
MLEGRADPCYRQTGNLTAVVLLLGHSKFESTVRYLGIEVDDAFEIAAAEVRLLAAPCSQRVG